MRKKVQILTIALVVVLIVGCKSTKQVQEKAKPLQETTEAKRITVPLSDSKYKTNKENFRAVQSGKSSDLAMAKKIAILNAKTEMANNIQTTLKAVTEQYSGQRNIDDMQEFTAKMEENTRMVTNQQLNDVRIIGEEIFQEKDRSYTYWIAIEMNKKAVSDHLTKRIGSDAKLQQDFDKYQFMKIFDEEMNKLENR